ncbi:unnamed protein product [Didymodactylos carnosus]|uniref:Telomere length regulation protein TEL2 homolog n=1 Tax=Didymodactylos carnosus TaxID=1234261 RepID=A0A815CMZ6_9BILA|nr:unnamed protein product [Didymodactylos carnosus]CAF1286224.1 unnamed protein product [Didymodactylos carnosus]CAF3991342.1 unnamed protein product [Didymodactylos carnosus]CAF4086938.1 unnamed protein product [Didymodactylos carnosus]
MAKVRGYIDFIWKPLYKNLFLKECFNNSLWLRIGQRFILGTSSSSIDGPIQAIEIIYYIIKHGNKNVLDLFISDRLLYNKSLENYLIDILIFHKNQIHISRKIIAYLTLNNQRREKCYIPLFQRLLNLWSQSSFIRFSSSSQHYYICQCICVCLVYYEHNETISIDNLIVNVLDGIRIHLESTIDYIRKRGQVIGELIINQLKLFDDKSKQLEFNSFDNDDNEVKALRDLATNKEIEENNDQLYSSDDDMKKEEQISLKESSSTTSNNLRLSTVPLVSSNLTRVVLHENESKQNYASDDDDDDEEFEQYDLSNDKPVSDIKYPSYIRACMNDLIQTENVARIEGALNVLPSLIKSYTVECEEIAIELTRILLNYSTTFNIDNFSTLQLCALETLCTTYPIQIGNYLCEQFYERNYTISQRMLILKSIQNSAKNLSQLESVRTKIVNEIESFGDDDDNDDDNNNKEAEWKTIVNERIRLKTKRKFLHKQRDRQMRENRFGEIVGHYFYPLLSKFDKQTTYLQLIDNDYILLCELLATLGRLCITAQNTLKLKQMVLELIQVLNSLQKHADAGVRHAVLYSYACCFVSISSIITTNEQLQEILLDLKQWLDFEATHDTNTECQKLARVVRNVLLNTLKEAAES